MDEKSSRCLQKVVSVQLTDENTVPRTPILINTTRCFTFEGLLLRILPAPSGPCLIMLHQQH